MWDLLANFTARWRKQAGTLYARKLRKMQEVCPAAACTTVGLCGVALDAVWLAAHGLKASSTLASRDVPRCGARRCAVLLGR